MKENQQPKRESKMNAADMIRYAKEVAEKRGTPEFNFRLHEIKKFDGFSEVNYQDKYDGKFHTVMIEESH